MRNKISWIILLIVLILISGVAFYFKKSPTTENNNNTGTTGNSVNFVRSGALGSVKSESLGEYLTDKRGITLYTYVDDKKLESACSGDCLNKWLPVRFDPNDKAELLTDTLSKKLNSAKASDGSRQYAFGDQPLYYYKGDFDPGDVNGNGFDNDKWGIVPMQTR